MPFMFVGLMHQLIDFKARKKFLKTCVKGGNFHEQKISWFRGY